MTNDRQAARSPGGRGGIRRQGQSRSRQPKTSQPKPKQPKSRQPKPNEFATKKPKIGDTRPAPQPAPPGVGGGRSRRRRRRGGRPQRGTTSKPVEALTSDKPVTLDEKNLRKRRGRTRRGRPLGRYSMFVHVGKQATHIATVEGRRLIEYFVSRPSDDVSQIHGNIYLGQVKNVLPGMETAFVDIGIPKNAVIYRGDVQYDATEIESTGAKPRIEEILNVRQSVLCQVIKNPIGEKGARLTQEVALAGRFVVLVPDSSGLGISKRLPERERRRLRRILERVRPKSHGLILRTAAEDVTDLEIERDVARLLKQWTEIKKLAERSSAPTLLYREPEATLRLIREELTSDFRRVVIDDSTLYREVSGYISSIIAPLADRVKFYDTSKEKLSLFERYFVEEQLRKALNPKVWLPSGGSLIIEHTEALTVVDVNTAKNVGKSTLEETVLANNLEAADELARQLRLRDIGGIIVVDFVDMESPDNREQVTKRFREALARDKTRTQVLDISGLGLLEMTRKRSGEGLLESLSEICESCSGRGLQLFDDLLD